jgi:hypothetical protein
MEEKEKKLAETNNDSEKLSEGFIRRGGLVKKVTDTEKPAPPKPDSPNKK